MTVGCRSGAYLAVLSLSSFFLSISSPVTINHSSVSGPRPDDGASLVTIIREVSPQCRKLSGDVRTVVELHSGPASVSFWHPTF